MDAIECIHTRRSIRRFEKRPVPEELIRQLLEAAMTAPSAGNQQLWHFVVINDRAILDQIPEFHAHAEMTKESPAAILVCADLKRETHKGFWVQDCSAATQNILLAARALGLGSVWVSVHPREERVTGFQKLLGLPDSVVPLSLVPIGYPLEKAKRLKRYKANRVHYNKF